MTGGEQAVLMTVDEVVKEYRIGRTKLYELLNTKSLSAVKIGRRTLLRRADIDVWLSEQPRYGAQSN